MTLLKSSVFAHLSTKYNCFKFLTLFIHPFTRRINVRINFHIRLYLNLNLLQHQQITFTSLTAQSVWASAPELCFAERRRFEARPLPDYFIRYVYLELLQFVLLFRSVVLRMGRSLLDFCKTKIPANFFF